MNAVTQDKAAFLMETLDRMLAHSNVHEVLGAVMPLDLYRLIVSLVDESQPESTQALAVAVVHLTTELTLLRKRVKELETEP